ncbi:RICIN domain-containing protein [Nostoc sp. C057]|uniref:RICIN domain-containing protein n=1 Tax=Nostoc sp. C057 TaxID=2576903 RepID=UPI0015C3C6B3|nr:RICIN domain-containing protein [Nostoc sp. C057]QLE46858.1 RICIN domain-containing protein [Nostoc sp. C057]
MVSTAIQTQSSDIQAFSENGTGISLDQRAGIIDSLDADRASNTWHKVTFDVPFTSNKKVVVIPMTQTYNGPDTPGLRIKNVISSGFEIRIDEVVGIGNLSDGSHTTEQVGWVAYGFSNLPTPGKYYYLVVKHTQKVLNVIGGSKENNIQLIQYDKSDSDNSKWLLEDAGDGSYYLVAKHSGKVANIAGGGSVDGANAIQYDKGNNDNSKWLLEDAGDGYFYIIGKQSGKVLQVNGGNKENNAKVDQWTKQNLDHLKWKFVAV